MFFRFSDIIPREHGVWAILLVPYLAGALARGKPGVPSLLLLICVISLNLLRGCGEFYSLNIVNKKEFYPNIKRRGDATKRSCRSGELQKKNCSKNKFLQSNSIKSFYIYTFFIFVLFLLLSSALLFYFQLWNLLIFGFLAFLLIGLYYLIIIKKKYKRITQQFIAFSGLTLTAPAAYYVTTGNWDGNVFIIWILNVIFFQLGMLYVHNKISLHQKRKQIDSFIDKLKFTSNLFTGWCFSVIILYGLFLAGLLDPVFFAILLPISIHIISGIFFYKRELQIKRMGYSLLGQDIFFLIIIIYLFRL